MRFPVKLFLLGFLLMLNLRAIGQDMEARELAKHLAYLSADELEGRKSGTAGNLLARDYIAGQFEKIGLESPYPDFLQEFRLKNGLSGYNVVGFIPGKSLRKTLIIMAHFDHVGIGSPNSEGDSIYNGADDNASGTAALIEMARYFSSNPPHHSLIFAALDAEEIGLLGARAFLKDYSYDREGILLVINMDMISRSEKGELYVSGTQYYPALKAPLEGVAQDSGISLLFGHDVPGTGADDWTMASDHGVFYKAGIPHLYFGVEDHEDYHQPSDEFQRVPMEFFVEASLLVLRSVKKLDEELIKP